MALKSSIFLCFYFCIFILRILFSSGAPGSACSGIIERTPGGSKEEEPKGSFSFLFQSLSQVADYRDNFVEMEFKVLGRYRRVLFITPQIAKWNPEGVKLTFVRLNCGSIGVLFRNQELSWLKQGTFFALSAFESRERLSKCLRKFEIRMGIKLGIVMIDSGPDAIDKALLEEFQLRRILLVKHPLNMRDGKLFYMKPPDGVFKKGSFEEDSIPNWYESTRVIMRAEKVPSAHFIQSTHEVPFYDDDVDVDVDVDDVYFEESETKDEENYKTLDDLGAFQKMNDLFGTLEEVPLSSSESGKTTPMLKDAEENNVENTNSANVEEIIDEPDYEIISNSDLR